jgi:cardiolipin synthase
MSAFPLILLGQFHGLWSRVVLAIGWGFLIWGLATYLWSFVLYIVQFVMVLRQLPRVDTAVGRSGSGSGGG